MLAAAEATQAASLAASWATAEVVAAAAAAVLILASARNGEEAGRQLHERRLDLGRSSSVCDGMGPGDACLGVGGVGGGGLQGHRYGGDERC